MSDDLWEALSDCPHCRTEAAVVLLMDARHPASHLGYPVDRRCRLCGHREVASDEPFQPQSPLSAGRCPRCQAPLTAASREGEEPCQSCGYTPTFRLVNAPMDLSSPGVAARALRRWAEEEGQEIEEFCRSNLGMSLDEAERLLLAREPLPTSFDVMAWLFPAGTGFGGAGTRTAEVVDRDPVPIVLKCEVPPEVMDARTPARMLAAVMVADGSIRPEERAFIDRFLRENTLEPLTIDDTRLWRPAELGQPPPRELAERLLEAAVRLSLLDREGDGSEGKVLRAFAAAWGVDAEKLSAWNRRYDRMYASSFAPLWRGLSRFVRTK